ncbi:MAG: hypothetical protein HY063_06400 [Bacteroidetes bacterium]|nr:hypothetical protein [Bacteroidota bacterium]
MKTLLIGATIFSVMLSEVEASLAQDTTQTSSNQNAISEKSGKTKAIVTGGAFIDFSANQKRDVKTNFDRTGFSPIFLWKLSDRLFFESEVEIEIEGGEVGVDVEYAKFSYVLNKYMAIGAGRMLTPFGAYVERLHPAFAERFPNAPLMMHHMDGMHAIGPNGAEMGVDVRGGFQLGNSKMNYALYVSNGPKLNNGSEDKMMAGSLEYENFYDNNSNKAVGGRIGFLPFSNSSLEIGLSGNSGIAGNAKDSLYKNIRATAYAIDLSYVKAIKPIKSIIKITGQLNSVTVDKANYKDPMDSTGMMTYTFNNVSQVYYLQVAFRPALLQKSFLKDIELLGRYNSLTYPKEALWGGGTTTRIDIGLCYWLSWRAGLRFAYETQKNPDGTTSETFLVRFATGF